MLKSSRPATLMREFRARIINISESGCLIETQRRLEVGTVGTMRVRLGTEEYGDDLEVVRCHAVEGARSYHVGLRFLWTTPRHAGSIRHGVAHHGGELDPSGTTWVM